MRDQSKRCPTVHRSIAGFNTLLLALWIAIDLIAMVLAISLSSGESSRLGIPWMIASIFLVLGTLHCVFLCIAENSRSGVLKRNAKSKLSIPRNAHEKNRSHRIFTGGLLGAALLAVAPLVYSMLPIEPEVNRSQSISATPEAAAKCSEIAGLEQKLFRADEKTVLGECLIQYGQMNTTVRGSEDPR